MWGLPYIKYRVGLFASGLEDNPTVKLSLSGKRKALKKYRKKWGTFNPVLRWQREIFNISSNDDIQVIAPGIYGCVSGSGQSIRFWTLVLPGTPRKKWEISLPDISLDAFAIDPHADALAVVEWKA